MEKKFFKILVSLFLNYSYLTADSLKVTTQSDIAILINADTGAILFEKNAYQLAYPASITKIATTLYALKKYPNSLTLMIKADHDSIASISPEIKKRNQYTQPSYWLDSDATHIGIKAGEELTFQTLLYGMMLPSGNDACNVLAKFIGGTIPGFMSQLNAYLKEIGCQKTLFHNPHGLHHPKHQTTAFDMALIAKEALKDSLFRQIVSTVKFVRPKTNKQDSTTMVQTNRLLKKGKFYYSKALGIKTGYTSRALHTLVAAAYEPKEKRTLIAVLLHCKERNGLFQDAINLFDVAFKEVPVERLFFKEGEQKFVLKLEGASQPLRTYIKESISLRYYPAEEPVTKSLLYWNQLKLPIFKDSIVGRIELVHNGQVLQSVSLLALEDISSTWMNLIKQTPLMFKLGGIILIFCTFGSLLFFLGRRQ